MGAGAGAKNGLDQVRLKALIEDSVVKEAVVSKPQKSRLYGYLLASSMNPNTSLRGVLQTMVEPMVSSLYMSPQEIYDFLKNESFGFEGNEFKVVPTVVDGFIEGIRHRDETDPNYKKKLAQLPQNVARFYEAKKQLREIIVGQYAHENGQMRLYEEVRNLSRIYDDIPLAALFYESPLSFSLDTELYTALSLSVEAALPYAIDSLYRFFFKHPEVNGGEKNHRLYQDHFVEGYILARVLTYVDGKIDINEENLSSLLNLLMYMGYPLDDNLYQIVYKVMKKLGALDVETVTESIRKKLGDEGGESFDLGRSVAYFSDNFEQVYNKFLQAEKKVKEGFTGHDKIVELGLIDLENIVPERFGEIVFSDAAIASIRKSARLYMDSDDPMAYVRNVFGLDVGVDKDGNTQEISDERVNEILGKGLDTVADFIKSVSEEALGGVEDQDFRNNFKFFEEIIDCRDVKKLIIWLAYPEKFVREHRAKYKGKSDRRLLKKISFQALKMIWLLLFLKKFGHMERIWKKENDAIRLEAYLKAIFGGEIVEEDMRFRAAILVDENGEVIKKDGLVAYKVFHENSGELEKPKGEIIDFEGKRWKLLKTEQKKLLRWKIRVLNSKGKEHLPVSERYEEVEIYLKPTDGKILNVKMILSIISNLLREGVDIKDILRMAFCNVPGQDLEKLHLFQVDLLERYFFDPKVVNDRTRERSIDRTEAGRVAYQTKNDVSRIIKFEPVDNGPNSGKTKKMTSSDLFKLIRPYAVALTAGLIDLETERNEPITFEAQSFNELDNFLLFFVSDETVYQHANYLRIRSIGLLKMLFPGLIYGREYLDLYDELNSKRVAA